MDKIITELFQNFIVLNVKLYEYKYGQTSEGRKRMELYNSICKSVLDLRKNGIADLNSLFGNLSLVFPMLSLDTMKSIDRALKDFVRKKSFDLSSYTDGVFIISTMLMTTTQHVTKLLRSANMRAEKHSRLDELGCKSQVIAVFKKIRVQEKINNAKGRTSAFAILYQQEIRPLLQGTSYFQAHIEYDENAGEIPDKNHTVNDRAYKSIKKLYESWKKQSASKLNRLLELFDKNFWSLSSNPENLSQNLNTKAASEFLEIVRNIDEIIDSET